MLQPGNEEFLNHQWPGQPGADFKSKKPKLLLASEGSGVNGFNHPLKVSQDRHSSRLVVLVDTLRHAQELEGVDFCRWNGLATDGNAWKDSLPCRRLDDLGSTLGHLGLQLCPLLPMLDLVQLMLSLSLSNYFRILYF